MSAGMSSRRLNAEDYTTLLAWVYLEQSNILNGTRSVRYAGLCMLCVHMEISTIYIHPCP